MTTYFAYSMFFQNVVNFVCEIYFIARIGATIFCTKVLTKDTCIWNTKIVACKFIGAN